MKRKFEALAVSEVSSWGWQYGGQQKLAGVASWRIMAHVRGVSVQHHSHQ